MTPHTFPYMPVTEEFPPRNVLVQVPNNEGARLIRRGNLWYVPDGSMYVYYVPTEWRPITN